MRILIIQDYLRCGGTERQSVYLSRFLADEGNEVGLLTFRPGGALEGEVPVDVVRWALQPRDMGLDWFAPGLFRAVRKQQPDVVLCMGRMANCYAGLIQLRFPDLTVVATVRTGKRLLALHLWSLRQVSGVLTNTAWWRTQLIERGVSPEKIVTVPNGLTFAWEGKKPAAARAIERQKLGVRPSTVVFVNVAGFRPGKRQALLIELFATLDPAWDWELWLVGDGKEWRRCARMADRPIDGGRVRLLGHRANPYACYAAADVAVSVSVEDALPNFLVEAQSLGIPAIAMDFRGVGEGMLDGETGFLIGTDDREGFLEAVQELYRRPQLRHRMGRRARVFAEKNFTSALQAAKTLEALQAFYANARRPIERDAKPRKSEEGPSPI